MTEPTDRSGWSPSALFGLLRRRPRLVGGTGAAVLAAVVLWAGTRTPTFRAEATLLLEPETPGNTLGGVLALNSASPASSQIAILRSRSILEETVREPADARVEAPEADFELHLGLTTLVDDESLTPFATLGQRFMGRERPPGRLSARISEPSRAPFAELHVSFLRPDRVAISAPDWGAPDREYDLVPGATLDYEGVSLQLAPEGDLTGRSFRVRALLFESAVSRLAQSTRVAETERNSGIIKLVCDDSDPERAAATANALALNYLEVVGRREARRASRTIDFIESQLEAQTAALQRTEQEVVALQKSRPETIDVDTTAKTLIEELSALEQERIHITIMRTALEQAVGLLQAGDLQALSRLDATFLDPVSRASIQQISELAAGSAVEGAALDAVIQAAQAGDDSALARLGSGTFPGLKTDVMTGVYLEHIAGLDVARGSLLQQYTPGSRVVTANTEVAGLLRDTVLQHLESRAAGLPRPGARALDDIVQWTSENLASRLAGLTSQQGAVENQVALLETRLGELPEDRRALAGPLRQLQSHEKIVTFLLSSLKEAEITRASTVASADLIDPALPPAERHSPHMGWLALLGSVLGLALGLVAAHWRERIAGTLGDEAELERATGLPLLATIPDFRWARLPADAAANGRGGPHRSFVALLEEPTGVVAEAYRTLKANVRLAAAGAPVRTLAVTSATPGEGKTSTNIGLALANARTGHRVLLVEADMRLPSVRRYLDLPDAPGLAEVLEQNRDWKECVLDGGHPNLSVLLSGREPLSASDLLAGPALDRFLQQAQADYDLVVFDVPATLPVADVSALAHKLDAVLFLYRAGGIHRSALEAAMQRLRRSGAHCIGAILNATGKSGFGAYGYGYGNGHDKQQAQSAAAR